VDLGAWCGRDCDYLLSFASNLAGSDEKSGDRGLSVRVAGFVEREFWTTGLETSDSILWASLIVERSLQMGFSCAVCTWPVGVRNMPHSS
jgi:hypothetical protein